MPDYPAPLLAVNPTRLRVAQFLVLLFHVTGFVGLAFSQNPDFYLRFTPLTLILTAGLLLAFEPERGSHLWRFVLTGGSLCFLAEVIGVFSHRIFGYYTYGDTLGFKVSAGLPDTAVPPLIALNWVVLTYVCGHLVRYLPLGELARMLLAALLMVGFDICLEPVAGTYDFWHWSANVIPFQNFRDWFILSCLMQMLFVRARFTYVNPLAALVFLTQLLFFFGLGFFG